MDNTLVITFLFGLTIFINLLRYLIFFDVILSWLQLTGLRWRPKFLSHTIDPVYKAVKSIIPTTFGPIDFTPIIVIFILAFLHLLIIGFFPEVATIQINR